MRRLLLLLFLAGCVQPIVWDAPETPQFKTDDYECTRDATYLPGLAQIPAESDDERKARGAGQGFANALQDRKRGPQLNEDLYIMCMESKGYTIIE